LWAHKLKGMASEKRKPFLFLALLLFFDC